MVSWSRRRLTECNRCTEQHPPSQTGVVCSWPEPEPCGPGYAEAVDEAEWSRAGGRRSQEGREKPRAHGVCREAAASVHKYLGMCVHISVRAGRVGRVAKRFWYLGAVPCQNLPFTASQRDLLLDGAFKFIWK